MVLFNKKRSRYHFNHELDRVPLSDTARCKTTWPCPDVLLTVVRSRAHSVAEHTITCTHDTRFPKLHSKTA